MLKKEVRCPLHARNEFLPEQKPKLIRIRRVSIKRSLKTIRQVSSGAEPVFSGDRRVQWDHPPCRERVARAEVSAHLRRVTASQADVILKADLKTIRQPELYFLDEIMPRRAMPE